MSAAPGPYEHRDLGVFNGHRELIASLNDADYAYERLSEDESEEELEATGDLLAAAPDLRVACKVALKALRGETSAADAEHVIEQALKRACGE